MIGRTMALALSLALAAGAALGETVEVDGGQIYYETCGKGAQAIVLIHDGVINSASFDDMWPVLCKDFRVVRYDRRGYGRSPAAKAPYSPQEDLGGDARRRTGSCEFRLPLWRRPAVSYAIDHPKPADLLILSGASLNGFKVSDFWADHCVMFR